MNTAAVIKTTNVVLVHGLWLRSWAMRRIGHYLQRCGYDTRSFSYPTTHQDLRTQAESLFEFSVSPSGELPNFVAHSMGGLITVQMLMLHQQIPSGRIVLLGSPLRGSSVAKTVADWPGGHKALGKAEETLVRGLEGWPYERDIGMVAGTRSLGLGVLAGGAKRVGDGTVLAEESHHEALDDHIEMAVTHTSMLLSSRVARQAAHFLRHGIFDHAAKSRP